MVRAFFSENSVIPLGFKAAVQQGGELSRALIANLKGVRFENLFRFRDVVRAPAYDEGQRLASEMKQALGVRGFALNLAGFRSLATVLPACWDAVRPCFESVEFEDASAQLLAEAANLAQGLGQTAGGSSCRLRHDEASYLQPGLDFYHFLLPKMLLVTSALRLFCSAELARRERTEKFGPEKQPGREDVLHELFPNIRRVLSLSPVQGAVAIPGAWAKYLDGASLRLRPVVEGENYKRASARLCEVSRHFAPAFQKQISLMESECIEFIFKQTTQLEALLPSLIISITWLEFYFRPADTQTSTQPATSCSDREAAPRLSRAPRLTPRPVPALSNRRPCAA